MTKFGKLIIATIIVLVILVGAFFLLKKNNTQPNTALPGSTFGDAVKSAVASQNLSEFTGKYENTDYGFKFSYPDSFSVKEIDEDSGFTVLAEGGANKTFQIYINSFDEPGPITPDRIKKDLPDMKIIQSQDFSLDGVPALAFQTDTTVEVWFVRGENLYQVTSLKDFTDDLSKILATWKFE